MKHGLYIAVMQPAEIGDPEMVRSRTLVHELVLARVALRRLARYLAHGNLAVKDRLAVMQLIFAGVRTVAHLQNSIDDQAIDWDTVLDELGEEWGMDL